MTASDSAVLAFVDQRGGAGVSRRALVSRAGLSASEADATFSRLTGLGARDAGR